MNKRRFLLPVFIFVAVCISAGPVWSRDDTSELLEEELEFARGLRKMGFRSLAVDQLQRTRGREYLTDEAQLKATRILARTYRELGEQAEESRDFEAKRDYYAKTIEEYTNFLEQAAELDKDVAEGEVKFLPDKQRHDLLLEKGKLAASLADDAATNMRGTTDEEESQQYRARALKWYKVGRDALKKAAKYFVKLRAETDVAGAGIEEKIARRKIRKKTGKVQMQYGQLLLDYARMFADSEDEEKLKQRKSMLETALETFKNVKEEYSIYAVRYKASRHMGMCYRELGSFKKSVEFLDKALEVERSPATAWIIRRSRLNLAQTYNAWGEKDPTKYEKADIAASALVNEVYNRAQVAGDQALIDILFAGWLEKGEAQVGHAKYLIKQAKKASEKGQKTLAQQRRNQARNQFRWAVNKANEISARTDSNWSRNAKVLFDQWLSLSKELLGKKIEVKKNISTYTAEGWRYFQEEKYFQAIEAFQKAIEVGNPAVYGASLIPESYYQIAVSYYKLSNPKHTEGNYTYYYEAATCFDKIVDDYPKAKFAPDAGYYGTQLFGSIFDKTQKMVKQGALPESAEVYDGRRYYEALRDFSQQFPDDPRARDTVFQSAEVARALEQYKDASEIYAKIKQEHPNYYEAKYRAGLCRYLQALKTYEEAGDKPPLKKISKVLGRAVDRFSDFIEWYDQNKEWLAAEQVPVVNRWVARTKITFGKLLVHEVWTESRDQKEGAKRALKMLKDIEKEHFADVDDEEFREQYLPEAFFVTIQSYRRMGQLRKAEKFVDGLIERFGKNQIAARAARLLGYAYLQRRDDLEEKGAEGAEWAASRGGHYLREALKLEPDQTLEFYNGTAMALIDMEEYKEAIKVLEDGLERFPLPENKIPRDAQLAALTGMKDAYMELEDWRMVEQTLGRLLDIEKQINEKREKQGKSAAKNINYRADYGLALEKQKKWEEALDYWRDAKGLADEMQGDGAAQLKFKCAYHLARCYAQIGGADNLEHGYKIMAWYLLSNDDWLRNKKWAEKVEQLFVDHLDDHMSDLAQFTYQLVGANVNLLRKPVSKKVIVDMTEKHWPDRQDQLDKLLERAHVEEATGQ